MLNIQTYCIDDNTKFNTFQQQDWDTIYIIILIQLIFLDTSIKLFFLFNTFSDKCVWRFGF